MKNKIPDCENCEYSNQNIGEKWCAGGHCYMFKEIMLDCKQFTIGYRNPNKNTLSGERELKKEYYLQYKL